MSGVGEIRAMAATFVRKGITGCPSHQTHIAADCEACRVATEASDNLKLLEELVVEVDNVLRYGGLSRQTWHRLAEPHGRVREGARAIASLYARPWEGVS